MINTEIGTEDIDYVITSDTDSMFIRVGDVVRHRWPDLDVNDRDARIAKILEVAGANKAANIGTAIHSFAERLDLGLDLGVVPPEWIPDIKAYEQATKILNNKFIEQFSVLDKYTIILQ